MARKIFGIAVLAMMTILATSALAQRSNEVSVVVGKSIISDEGVKGVVSGNPNIHFGAGWSYEGNFSHRLLGLGIVSLAVEVPFVYDPETKVQFAMNQVPRNFSAYFLTPAARVNLFPTTAFSPWVSVGGGFARFTPGSNLEFGGINPTPGSKTSGVFEVGGGVDVRVAEHFLVRGAIRDFNSSEPPINLNQTNRYSHIFAGVGLVLNF